MKKTTHETLKSIYKLNFLPSGDTTKAVKQTRKNGQPVLISLASGTQGSLIKLNCTHLFSGVGELGGGGG